MPHKCLSSSTSNVTNNKNVLYKTVRLTSFQKPQLQCLSIFFNFVRPCFLWYLLCLLRDRFTVQCMLVKILFFCSKMLFFCRDMLYRLCKQYDHVVMLSKNQSAHSPGSHLINLGANSCKVINHGIKPSGQQ